MFKELLGRDLFRVTSALEHRKPVLIRGNSEVPGIFSVTTGSGSLDLAFRNFMLSKGYDGMIYCEGGEGKERQDLTGFVFYNCQVVDTWAGWQKREK